MSNETFKVGEIAIISAVSHPDIRGDWVGKEVEILGPLEPFRGELAYRISHPLGQRAYAYAAPRHLRKRRPPPQREATSSWDDVIVWRPKEIAHV